MSHVKLEGGRKAASKTAAHCTRLALLSFSLGGKCFFATAPETPMNALYVVDVPCGTAVKVTRVFRSPIARLIQTFIHFDSLTSVRRDILAS